MATWTDQSKHTSTFANQGISGLALWGDPVFTWGDTLAGWGDERSTWIDYIETPSGLDVASDIVYTTPATYTPSSSLVIGFVIFLTSGAAPSIFTYGGITLSSADQGSPSQYIVPFTQGDFWPNLSIDQGIVLAPVFTVSSGSITPADGSIEIVELTAIPTQWSNVTKN